MCKTKYDSNVRRGAIVKAMAIFSRYQYTEELKKCLELSLDQYFNDSNPEILKVVFKSQLLIIIYNSNICRICSIH